MELCRLDELQDGEARGFAVPEIDRKVILVRRRNTVFAYLDACPHYVDGTPMGWKRNAYLNGAGTHLSCHAHGALFDIETGECVLGPCLGQGLTKVPIHVDKFGGIQATVGILAEESA